MSNSFLESLKRSLRGFAAFMVVASGVYGATTVDSSDATLVPNSPMGQSVENWQAGFATSFAFGDFGVEGIAFNSDLDPIGEVAANRLPDRKSAFELRRKIRAALAAERVLGVDQLAGYASSLAEASGISLLRAYSVIWDDLAQVATFPHYPSVRAQFFRALFSDDDKLPEIIRGLPSGGLRDSSLSILRGREVSLVTLNEIYLALPDSDFRRKVAAHYVTQVYFRDSLESAMRAVRLLELDRERQDAVRNLHSQMQGAALLGLHEVPKGEIEFTKEWLKKN